MTKPMTDDDLARLMNERASNACSVTFRRCTAIEFGSPEERLDATKKGVRVAEVRRDKKPIEVLLATGEQTRKLISAGAKPAPEDLEAADLDEPDDDDDA